jgi:hypothetical protein
MPDIRRSLALVLALAAALAIVPAAPPARAHDLGRLLRQGKDLPEVRRLAELHRELHHLLDRYESLEARAGRAWLEATQMAREVAQAEHGSEEAKARLDERIRTAYQLGPGGPIEALLGAPSIADLPLIAEYVARTVAVDDTALREALIAEAVVMARRGQAEAARAALEPRLERLRGMLEVLQEKVAEATRLAERAHLEAQIAEQQARVAAAAARSGSWDLGVIGYGKDQSDLLALLGPTGGRTCETPEGLVETGQGFEGYASWYGWEFGGRPTATGAIFDPRLFTAANRWLPFGTFLRVRHGDRCAIVFINDRGPYGKLERVIDLSEASAEYLGVGVSWVTAEILLPRESLDA